MDQFNWRKIALVALGVSLLVLVVVLLRWSQIPPATVTVYSIEADRGFETVIVSTKTTTTSSTFSIGKREYRHAPEKLDFESTNGPVDVYWAPINLGYKMEHWKHIESLKQEFAEGRVPKAVAGHSSGASGRLKLKHRSNDGHAHKSYLIMIRSPAENEVTLKVHYGHGWRR